MRTDDNRNPAAFTVDLAKQAGLIQGVDYEPGTPFPAPSKLVTARILGDPIAVTIRLIDRLGYYTATGKQRWDYIAIPHSVWRTLPPDVKKEVIQFHYIREGGTAMKGLF